MQGSTVNQVLPNVKPCGNLPNPRNESAEEERDYYAPETRTYVDHAIRNPFLLIEPLRDDRELRREENTHTALSLLLENVFELRLRNAYTSKDTLAQHELPVCLAFRDQTYRHHIQHGGNQKWDLQDSSVKELAHHHTGQKY